MRNEHLVLTTNLHDICVGTMLGDSTMQTQSRGKTWRIKFQMAERYQDLANKICHEFGTEWIPSPLHRIQRENSNMLGFQTLSTSALLPIAELFFSDITEPKPRRIISPLLIENHLSPLGLAHWFMGDGSKGDWTSNEGKQIHLHTQSFTLLEVEMFCEGLRTKFGFEASPRKNKGAHIVLISGRSYEEFVSLVDEHLVPSLRSRLPSPRKKRNELMT